MAPIALTIAGSDPSGGAGIQADLKTFHQFGVYGTSVITLVTAQNTCRVSRVEPLAGRLVEEQLDAVLDDLFPQAAKTGALGTSEIIEVIADRAKGFRFPLVVDPIFTSKHGPALLDAGAQQTLKRQLLPKAFLVTPNALEAEALTGRACRNLEQAEEVARALADLGPPAVLVTGGHLDAEETATDVLFYEGRMQRFSGPRIGTRHTHGTGCAYSAAITAQLAKGVGMVDAVACAKEFVARAIGTSPGLGQGFGPLNYFAPIS